MPELYHKLGVGVISWSPHSLSNDDGIQLISRRGISSEEKSFRSAKQLELNTLAVRLGCDSVQLAIGMFNCLREDAQTIHACFLFSDPAAWSLRNDQTNCVLIAPRSMDQLYLHLNSLKILTKLTASVMDDVESILNNKPAVKRRGQSVSDRSAMVQQQQAAAAAAGGVSSPINADTAGAGGGRESITSAAAVPAVSSGPVQV